jgi:glucose/arabinose dehydrogenase
VRPYAWGFRNIIGLAWNKNGSMFAVQNGYDNAAGRPINDAYDPTYRVKEGAWYGWPDFAANGDPVTSEKYKAMAAAIPAQFINAYDRKKRPTF